MLEDISVYKNIKRNDKCPCGSGKTFKQCCMKEYRILKKNGGSKVKLSTYSPITNLTDKEKQTFTNFYIELMIFSNQYKYKTNSVVIDNIKENMQGFVQKERKYFYENNIEIIKQYIEDKSPSEEILKILEGLKSAKLNEFFLLSRSEYTAVIMDKNENFYNIQALNSPFNEIFKEKEKYLGIQTALIPYKNRYITDGIFEAGPVSKELVKYFDSIPYKNPEIIYNQDKDFINQEFALTFSIGCKVKNFEKMEEMLLKKIPKSFSLGLVEQLKTGSTFSLNIISSFVRTTDFLELLDNKKGHQTLSCIFGGLPVTNFERGNKNGIISNKLLEYYYKQVPIGDSVSSKAYNNAKRQSKSFQLFSSFYTILGIANIKRADYDKYHKFIETFKTKVKRNPIATGIENLCDEFSEELGFQIEPVFIDATINLDEIVSQISEYYNFMKNQSAPSTEKAHKYSRSRKSN